jgi:hypothetical protein
VVDPDVEENVYVRGRLITSGNNKVLHHVVSYIVAPGRNEDGTDRTKAQLEAKLMEVKGVGIGGRYDCFGGPTLNGSGISVEMLDAWAPGGVPNIADDDSGQLLDKDALVIMDVHYHPSGKTVTDEDTRLSLMLTDGVPDKISRVTLLGNFEESVDDPFVAMLNGKPVGEGALIKQKGEDEVAFMIPANARGHVEEMLWTWKTIPVGQFRITLMGTHMHYVGTNLRVTLEHEDGEEECLIETPRWNFNWQRGYAYDAEYDDLPVMRDGDKLHIRCEYDNSMDNAFVVQALDDQGLDEPVDVPLGEDTLHEMCLAAIGISYPNPLAER